MAKHLMIKAGAGTGKTTSITQGVYKMAGMKTSIKGSEEQLNIWDAMCEDLRYGLIHMTSFTRDASDQLAEMAPRGPDGNKLCSSNSTYGMGLAVAKKAGQAGYVDRWEHKYKSITSEFLGGTRMDCNEKYPGIWDAIFDLQSKARLDLKLSMTVEEVKTMAEWYGIDVPEGITKEGTRNDALVTEGINYCLKEGAQKLGTYDFTDMVYLPVIQGLIRKKYDTIIVDEAQDMGKAQQEIILGSSFQRIVIGDPHQAIFMFSGADAAAFERLREWLGMTLHGVNDLPLTLTRRCAKSIVEEANQFDPSLRALPEAPDGVVRKMSKGTFLEGHLEKILNKYDRFNMKPKDLMIICPTNAPLIGIMFSMYKRGIKCYINGGDITSTMVNFCKKHGEEGIGPLRFEIDKRLRQIEGRRNTKNKEAQLDQYEALRDIATECHTTSAVISTIDNMFSDTPRKGWIPLSTIHKAKGKEADTVVVWNYDRCRSPYSNTPAQHQQDRNLEHVAYTRAMTTLIKVPR